nr:hypothetical protein SYMBAF_110154 [Serratia symbiotica]
MAAYFCIKVRDNSRWPVDEWNGGFFPTRHGVAQKRGKTAISRNKNKFSKIIYLKHFFQ